jgi:glycosyltransferase involved in cell wall biosynthesis
VRDLLVSSFTPTLHGGARLRTYAIIRALAAWRGVDVVYSEFGASAPAPEVMRVDGVRLHAVRPSRGVRRGLAYARARATGVPDGFARGVSPELAATVAELAGSADRGRVIADGPTTAATLAALARRRPAIYSAENLESAFRGPESGGQRRLRSFERRLLRTYAETWMVNRGEVTAAEALAPGAAVRYVPNVVDAAAMVPVTPARDPVALFVADYTWPPNQEGLRFLVADVMPRVWQREPAARLLLVGRGLDGPPSTDDRIEALGFVDDLRETYARAAAAVVPLLRGGGTPLKFLEALAYGLPVVATSAAAAGLDVEPGIHYVQADEAVLFADALAGVLVDGYPQVASRGRSLVEQEYSIQALTRLLAP